MRAIHCKNRRTHGRHVGVVNYVSMLKSKIIDDLIHFTLHVGLSIE